MARHRPILRQNEAMSLRKVSKYLLGQDRHTNAKTNKKITIFLYGVSGMGEAIKLDEMFSKNKVNSTRLLITSML